MRIQEGHEGLVHLLVEHRVQLQYPLLLIEVRGDVLSHRLIVRCQPVLHHTEVGVPLHAAAGLVTLGSLSREVAINGLGSPSRGGDGSLVGVPRSRGLSSVELVAELGRLRQGSTDGLVLTTRVRPVKGALLVGVHSLVEGTHHQT